MKANFYYLAGLVGMILSSCATDVILDDKIETKNDSHFLKVEVTDKFAAAATRADYSGFPTTTFEEDDAIGMYAFNGTSYVASNVRYVKQSDGSWLPDEDVPYCDGYTYYAYFPYRSTVYTPSTSGTVDAIDTKFADFIADGNNYFWQADQSTKAGFTYSNLMIAKGTVTDVGEDEATVKFTMAHKRGLAVFNGEDATDVTFTGNIPYLMTSTRHFLMKPSVSTSFTDDLGTYSMTAPAGEYATHSIVIPTTDLSMVDNAGNARASMTTANCYLVHAAGKYKLPMVYGNAIKDGTANTVAYAPGGSTTSTYCANFINHAGNTITGPWITKNGSGVDAGMNLTAASAELLWQDASGLISSVRINGDYLTFKIGNYVGGNALIAVKDGSGTVLWSWHIWATEDDLSNTTVVATGSHDYIVAPVDLGWVPTGGDGKQGYCPYYQWGRKDPLLPGVGVPDERANKTIYDISGTDITPSGYNLQIEVSETATIADNIKNPIAFYMAGGNYASPVTTTYCNMWDAQNTATDNVTTATKKTIYDPCPPGFCVPTGNLWYYFGNGSSRMMSTYDSTNKGATWNTDITGSALWFPAVGIRYSGVLNNQNYRWSATPTSSSDNACDMEFSSSRWYWSKYEQRSFACCVRPVAEE